MKQPSENQILMRRYLTGELSERERDELEEKYFNDDELFGELLESEERIIDDYRRGQLAPSERERLNCALSSSGLTKGTEQAGLTAPTKSLLLANEAHDSTLHAPASETSAVST